MNYTREKLNVSPAYGEKGELCYYNVKVGSQSLASFHDNNYINVDLNQAKGNAILFTKASEMYAAINLFINGKKSLHDQPKAVDKMKGILEDL